MGIPVPRGGGGGGDHSKQPASKGKLPKLAMIQIAPPTVIIRNEQPKLAVEPRGIAPPQIELPTTTDVSHLGDLWSKADIPSNGPGGGGGIGDGQGTGVGPGKGPGAGEGEGGGYGGGVFHMGGGVSAPAL